jgi:hypothetical protein
MNQTGKSIHPANLQEFLDSAANAVAEGQQQFQTPANLAAALRSRLPAVHSECLADLHMGAGNILKSIPETVGLGLDIDARVSRLTAPEGGRWHPARADLTLWYPLAKETDLRLPFIAINPPFSLQWHTERLAPLADSTVSGVADCYKAQGKTINSTLASFLIALDLLSAAGEGFMVANADTARRLFGDPCDPSAPALHPDLRPHIWQWLEIPGAVFEGVSTAFDTAVLYFRRAEDWEETSPPSYLRAPSSDPATIARILAAAPPYPSYRLRDRHQLNVHGVTANWKALREEYAARHLGEPPQWNISLMLTGRIRCHLTPFQEIAKAIPRAEIDGLLSLHDKAPMSFCVTATSRTILRRAVRSPLWNVQPALLAAVDKALEEYERLGSPFYQPTPIQSLGWVDEHSHLTCSSPGIGSAKPGDKCPIECSIEDLKWKGTKTNLSGEPETLTFTGKELLVTLTDPAGHRHHFHARREDKEAAAEYPPNTPQETHHHAAALVDHFHIPTPKDIAALNPDAYRDNLHRLTALEARMNGAA